MKKVSIISPVFEKVNNISETINGLISFFKDKYDFEVYYYYNGELSAEVMQDYHFNFIKIDKDKNFNDCVTDGFERVNGDCVVVADLSNKNYQDFLVKLLVEWESKAQVVLVKKQKGESFWGKVKNFFVRIGQKIYDSLLGFANLNNDFHCYNNFQLFSKEVVEVIKSFPERNFYLRNFDCWVDFKVSILWTNENLKINNKQKVLTKDFWCALGSFALCLATLFLTIFGGRAVADENKVLFNLIGIGLILCLGVFAIYNLYWWFISRKTFLERNNNHTNI